MPKIMKGDKVLTSEPVIAEVIYTNQLIQEQEVTRQTDEIARNNAETDRVTSENTRKSNEITRQADESTRQSQEATRQSQETDRINAESARVTEFNAFIANAYIIPKTPVATYADIATTYPTPANGWTVKTLDDGNIYRYDGESWAWTDKITSSSYDLLLSNIGNMSTLSTTEKTNIVGAINEVDGDIGDLTQLQTASNTDLVGAINENTEQLTNITPLTNKVIFASKYNFTNSTGDSTKFENLFETVVADILYIDIDICIDAPLKIDGTSIKKVIGLGGVIKLTNKLTSLVPCIEFEYCNNLILKNVDFIGDFDKTLINSDQWIANLVSPLFLSHCENIEVDGCSFSNIITAGTILMRFCKNITINNNYILNCWGHVPTDVQGDGIYVGNSSNITISNNRIVNNFTSITELGRVGITIEFQETMDIICFKNYIYGYDRAFHCELIGGNILIKNNIVKGCAIGFVGWQNNNKYILFKDNFCSNIGIPTDYICQLLQGSKGFISFYTNDATIECNLNTTLDNNEFLLESDVIDLNYFIFSKITGESYNNNRFINMSKTKQIFMYNPNETTINNNKLIFTKNNVYCDSITFSHIGTHNISDNDINVNTFGYVCSPTPTTSFINRKFINNEIKNITNNVQGLVNNGGHLFMSAVSMMCKDNTFIDIKKIEGQVDTIIMGDQDYSANLYLKSIYENNILISTQAGTVTLMFNWRMGKMMYDSITNKHILNGVMVYESGDITNKSLIVNAPDGSERIIDVDTSGVVSATVINRNH